MHFISGPGVETRAAWGGSIYAAMADIYHNSEEITAVVSHGGSLTYIIASWIGMPLEAADTVKFRATAGSITVLHDDDLHGDHGVVELSSTDHLF